MQTVKTGRKSRPVRELMAVDDMQERDMVIEQFESG
jgi:hypothetical protein